MLSAIISAEVIVTPSEFSYGELIKRLRDSGITRVGLYANFAEILEFVDSSGGRSLLKLAAKSDINLTYVLHATEFLMPRALIEKNPDLGAMDESGRRTPDGQLCVSSSQALEIVENMAAKLVNRLPDAEEKYHLWPDARKWCSCPECSELTDSDQSLIFANSVCSGVREVYPLAKTAYYACDRSLPPPTNIEPAPGVFLDFVPSNRSYEKSIDDPASELNHHIAEQFIGLMDLFEDPDSCVLEGWLDASRHSLWQRPPVNLSLNKELIRKDLQFYANYGIQRIASFAFWLDHQYEEMHGPAPFEEFVHLAASIDLSENTPPGRLR